MEIRPATMADVRHIGQEMWARGVVELDALGIGPAMWLEGWRIRINRDDAVAIGEHAILGCDWESEDVCNTSFQAAKSFELPGIGKQVTKALRAEIPRLMTGRGAKVVLTYSLCIDPGAAKWFRLLGLEEDIKYPGPQCGPFRLRRFIRRA